MSNDSLQLKDKNIIVGITGSIAAYKAATLTRLLIKQGAKVKVVMTPLAKEFITPVTMATLSQNTVLSDFFNYDDGAWNSHVDLGLWADLFLLAPASANTMAKMAHGICDNLLLTTYLSVRCPAMIAPAMDMDMFQHPATQANIEILKQRGNSFVEPETGELASGLIGKGRMEEPEKITEEVIRFFQSKKKLQGKQYLVTAGPTNEKIDPVRFIGNHSSGKMGYALAEELANQGAEVELVSGSVTMEPKHPNIHLHNVTTAAEMFELSKKLFPTCNGAIMAAAVADYTIENTANEKIKRQKGQPITLTLTPTKDIAEHLGKIKKDSQVLVGFALETTNEEENALKKLRNKNLDFIVLNSLRDSGAGFNTDTNKISILDANGEKTTFPLKSKYEVAKDIVLYMTEK
ncbi:MAG: bifunctional phosphopantothenoylcysteine decarboxylase/phosphopantothenate--cysteine ligase CoaBC [Salinivirgaceae bacterium]|jgi:phosphopantothenoylcysteine decarboxylase/phosphopantothenate--cysteine ligase|nr:bifunctional phosphopantothenoylcysteine decarboxylase/phosphopantothenate--cysteine ligase CoaBC [Salinivirgaceae bacterium]